MHRVIPSLAGLAVILVLAAGLATGVGWFVEGSLILSADQVERTNATPEQGPQFRDVAQDTGLNYSGVGSHHPATDEVTNAGAYASDFNNDGWTDVLLVGDDRPILYENVGGEFRPSGTFSSLTRDVQAALFFDYDNDGWEDLLLLSKHRKPLFFENEGGSFKRARVGLNRTLALPTGASVADYNRDGCLDLFVVQMGNWSTGPPSGFHYTVDPGEDDGGQNLLYRGTCSGFVNVTETAGIRGTHWSLATSFVDVTSDGRPDIHVANDFGRDTLYVNRGNDSFERRPIGRLVNRSGTYLLGPNTNRNAMSSEIADVNGDGHLDLFVTNIYSVMGQYTRGPQTTESQGNNLFLGGPNATFRERSAALNVEDGGWGWAAAAVDFDDDGDRDLVHTTMTLKLTPGSGLTTAEIRSIYRRHPSYRYPVFFERTGSEFSAPAPNATGFQRTDGRGLVAFDFDNDGDQDVLIANAGGAFRLYENCEAGGNALQVRLPSGDALPTGARVYVTAGNHTSVGVRNARSDFLSQDSRTLHFGVADHQRVDVRVVWPTGTERRFEDVAVGQRLALTPAGVVRTVELDGPRNASLGTCRGELSAQ